MLTFVNAVPRSFKKFSLFSVFDKKLACVLDTVFISFTSSPFFRGPRRFPRGPDSSPLSPQVRSFSWQATAPEFLSHIFYWTRFFVAFDMHPNDVHRNLFDAGQNVMEFIAYIIEAGKGKELHEAVMPDVVQVGSTDDLRLFLESSSIPVLQRIVS